MANIKKTDYINIGKNVIKLKLIHCWCKYKMVWPFWKTALTNSHILKDLFTP